MKIIISENQELKAKKKIAFFLLDKQNYNLIEINNRIYFAKNIGDNYSEIRYDKEDGWCGLSGNLISFLSKLTGFEESEVQELIIKWVEHTLQMKVKYNSSGQWRVEQWLNIPYK